MGFIMGQIGYIGAYMGDMGQIWVKTNIWVKII